MMNSNLHQFAESGTAGRSTAMTSAPDCRIALTTCKPSPPVEPVTCNAVSYMAYGKLKFGNIIYL